jgi:class 3 adenylate cyclase/tetratricopeptide (TPR) repeat protein
VDAPAALASPQHGDEAERRQITVMFADLVDSTARSASMDAEEYQDVVRSYHACVANAVERFGGHVSQYLGDGVLVYFGYPRAHEDDAARSLHAALAVIGDVAKLDVSGGPLRTRIGIASGTVVVGPVFGRSIEPEQGAVGETPNLAARLQSLAEPQTIVVDQRTRRLAGAMFQFSDLGPHSIKGFPQPIVLFRVSANSVKDIDSSEAGTPFVGRELERSQLSASLEAASRGRGCAIALKGDAGIGKSRLLREFLTDAAKHGFVCHKAHVLDFGTSGTRDALGILALSLLDCAFGDTGSSARDRIGRAIATGFVDQDAAPFLYDLIGIPLPDELRVRFDAMDKTRRDPGRGQALASLVREVSRRQPLIVAVEDVHWADQPMLSHLRQLVAAIEERPVVVVLTTRTESDPLDASWRAQTTSTPLISLELSPLGRGDAEILARQLSSTMPDRVKHCLDRAAGNPLFLEQLLSNQAEGDREGVPDTIQGIVQARIDRLAQPERLAIQAASILGQEFSIDALRALTDNSAFDIDRLVTGLMITWENNGYRFAHALIHQAVYESILRTKRREWHRRAAQWFVNRDPLLVAAHLDRAEHRDEAARAYLVAARQHANSHRYESASQLLERGLHLANNATDRAALLLQHGEVLQDLGQLHGSLQAFEEAARVASDPNARCNALIGGAGSRRVLDDLEGAAHALDEAEALAASEDLKLELAKISYIRGNLCFPRGDTEGCLREHSKSLRIAQTVDAPMAIAAALGGLGDAEYMRGRMLSAHRYFGECVQLARTRLLGKIEIANRPMWALTRLLAGEPEQALAEAEETIRMGEATGQLRAQMVAHHAAYLCLHGHLALEPAAAHAEKALELSRQLKAPRFEAEALAFRADVHRMAGRWAEAREDIDEALMIGRRSGMAYFGPTLLSVAALISKDPAEQCGLLAEADTIVGTSVSHNRFFLHRNAINVFYALKRPDEIERHAAALDHFTRHERIPWSDFYVDRGKLLAASLRDPSGLASNAWNELELRAKALWLEEAMVGIP